MINRGINFFSFRTTELADSSMIESNQSEDGINNSLQVFLVERNSSDYIDVVPKCWLELGKPEPNVHLYFSIVFLTICIPGNLSQLLVMLAYTRYIVCTEILWTNVIKIFSTFNIILSPFLSYRKRKLRTASNRLLLSLLMADFILLLIIYPMVYQILQGAPIFGVVGKNWS